MHFIILFVFLFSAAFMATPEARAADVSKGAEVPFREDSGLITAEYYLATQKYSQAIAVASAVLKRHPQSADAYAYRGYAQEKLGDAVKARADYERALQANPTHLGAMRYLAGLDIADGKTSEAFEKLQAIRMICAETGCEEQDDLEAAINKAKGKTAPAAP